MYNFDEDLKRWREYVLHIHGRYQSEKRDLYTASQSIIEAHAHRLLARAGREKRRILEVGIGGGEHFHFENEPERHEQYVGIDIVLKHARIAKKISVFHVLNADGACLPVRSNYFDCCISFGVLEHVNRLRVVLKEISRTLVSDGEILIVVPTNGGLLMEFSKWIFSYPALYRRGIRKPSWIWHYENVNHFTRIHCLLNEYYDVQQSRGIPIGFLPWYLSPLWFFRGRKR